MGLVLTWLPTHRAIEDMQSLIPGHVESLHAYARRLSTSTPPFPLALQPNRQKWSLPEPHIVEVN